MNPGDRIDIRLAKNNLRLQLSEHPSFCGIGLGRDCLVVNWLDENDQPSESFEGWPVCVVITGIAVPLSGEDNS